MLRTALKDGCVSSTEGYFLDEAHLDFADGQMLLHDAAAAHAYKQALNDWRNLPAHAHAEQWSVEWVEGRAIAIMREWGFEERARS